jgi:hypothetical protein
VRLPRLLALLLVLVIAGLAPATYADPPDPSWLGGYWDDDDFDDVIILLNGTVAIVQTLVLHAAPPGEVVALVHTADAITIPPAVDETASPRAPPLTLALLVSDHRIVARHH